MKPEERAEIIARCKGSFLFFCRMFYELLNQREFIISNPPGREPHAITIARELVACQRLETKKLIINVPPGHGKSTLLSFWIAWCFIHNNDCRFLYVSCSKDLAATHTDTIRRIMMMPEYTALFDVHLRTDSKAKDFFQTTQGGAVAAFGSSGTIVGRDAGYPGLDRFSGALIIDDAHKPDEVHSDVMREAVIQNYRETLQMRTRGTNVPIVFIGQRVHEADLAQYLLDGKDGSEWKRIVLKAIDDAGNPLYPEAFPLQSLLIKKERDIYVFASQMQQNPQPAGGALFKKEWFLELENEPTILATFITADTAETNKTWNDATVFGFFGIYRTPNQELALHCLHLLETRVEPKDLEMEFMRFWSVCLRHPKKPRVAAIEKKSTGVTLSSVLQKIQGLQIRDIPRSGVSGGKQQSKTQRFLNAQPYFASKLLTFPRYGDHNQLVIEHLSRITANETHAFDDIADVCVDAVRIGLIDQSIVIDEASGNIASVIMQDNINRMNVMGRR